MRCRNRCHLPLISRLQKCGEPCDGDGATVGAALVCLQVNRRRPHIATVLPQMNLDEQFTNVRTQYFPRWAQRGDWTIAFGSTEQLRGGNTAYCDTDAKVIYLDQRTFPTMSADGQLAFIIHEICHDVGAAFHNRRWALRMERAAKDAERLDESEVAEILRSDIYSYFGNGLSLDYTVEGLSTYLNDLFAHNPEIRFGALRKRVSRFFGYRISKIERDFGCEIQRFADSFGIEYRRTKGC